MASAEIPLYGSTGIGDVTPLSHLILSLFGEEFKPARGETLPLIAQNSISTAQAAFAVYDLKILLNELVVLASFDIEAFQANPSPYHLVLGQFRRFPGYQCALNKINQCLEGSQLLSPDFEQRHLQSPLSFRCLAIVLGNAFEALMYCENIITIELNAHQQNPLAWHEKDCMLPCAHFDMQTVASALDFARISLAPVLTSQVERSLKLLQASQTGLTDGLEPFKDTGGFGLSELAFPLQALLIEAKTLITPVSAEVGSSMQAEGIEDRITMAGLAARRLQEMVELSFRIASIGVVISCQAIDLRQKMCASKNSYSALDNINTAKSCIRQIIPEIMPSDSPPKSLENLDLYLKGGILSRSVGIHDIKDEGGLAKMKLRKSKL